MYFLLDDLSYLCMSFSDILNFIVYVNVVVYVRVCLVIFLFISVRDLLTIYRHLTLRSCPMQNEGTPSLASSRSTAVQEGTSQAQNTSSQPKRDTAPLDSVQDSLGG